MNHELPTYGAINQEIVLYLSWLTEMELKMQPAGNFLVGLYVSVGKFTFQVLPALFRPFTTNFKVWQQAGWFVIAIFFNPDIK